MDDGWGNTQNPPHLVDGVETLELVCHQGTVVINGFAVVVVVGIVVVVVGTVVVVVVGRVVVVGLAVVVVLIVVGL